MSSKLLISNDPTACFFAKSKSTVIPSIPNASYEKYRLIIVGTDPRNIPPKKKILNIFFTLNKL
tara:strand:+ start:314 stop:505 length:192 start_codon:yes stop_codon:yes gene_type:complete